MPFLRKYGTGTGADVYIPIIKAGVVDFAVTGDWTPTAGDVKISIDGGAAANIGTLPVINGTHDWKFVFADAELQGKTIRVRIVDSATKAVEDQSFTIETYGHASAMYRPDFTVDALGALMPTTAGRTLDVSATGEAGLDFDNIKQASGATTLTNITVPVVTTLTGHTPQTADHTANIAAIKAKTDNLPADPADASDIATSFSGVNTKLDTIDDFLDTEIAAIKAKTDNLPSDPADQSAVEAAITAATSPLATQASVNTIDDFLDTEIAAIKAKTDNLPTDPADASDIADLIGAVDDFVDTEIAAIKAVTDKLDDTLEDDGGTYRFTTNALEQAPSGGSGGFDPTDSVPASPSADTYDKAFRLVLNHVDADISSVAGTAGAGAISYTTTIRTTGGTPIANAEVWVTTDSGGTNVIAGSLVTDASGNATFMLDAGSYYLWVNKPGVSFTNPSSFTVS